MEVLCDGQKEECWITPADSWLKCNLVYIFYPLWVFLLKIVEIWTATSQGLGEKQVCLTYRKHTIHVRRSAEKSEAKE